MDPISPLPDYRKWRELFFSVTPEQGGIKSLLGPVYGAMMDVGLTDNPNQPEPTNLIISVTAFATGESSMKTSFGGGVLGLGGMEAIAQQAKAIVSKAQHLLAHTEIVTHKNLPTSANVFFYFLTRNGVHHHACAMRELTPHHAFGELFARFSYIKGIADKVWDEHRRG